MTLAKSEAVPQSVQIHKETMLQLVAIVVIISIKTSHSSHDDIVSESPKMDGSMVRLETPSNSNPKGSTSPPPDAMRSYRSLEEAFTAPIPPKAMSHCHSFPNLDQSGEFDASPISMRGSEYSPLPVNPPKLPTWLNSEEVDPALNIPANTVTSETEKPDIATRLIPQPMRGRPPLAPLTTSLGRPLLSPTNADEPIPATGPRQRLPPQRCTSCPPHSRSTGRSKTARRHRAHRYNREQYLQKIRREIRNDWGTIKERLLNLSNTKPKRQSSRGHSPETGSIATVQAELEWNEEFKRVMQATMEYDRKLKMFDDTQSSSVPHARLDGINTADSLLPSPITPETSHFPSQPLPPGTPDTVIHRGISVEISPPTERTPGSTAQAMPSDTTTIGIYQSSSSSSRHKAFKLPKPQNENFLRTFRGASSSDNTGLTGTVNAATTGSAPTRTDSSTPQGDITKLMTQQQQQTAQYLDLIPQDESSSVESCSIDPTEDPNRRTTKDPAPIPDDKTDDHLRANSFPRPPPDPPIPPGPNSPHSGSVPPSPDPTYNPFVEYLWVIVALGVTLIVCLCVLSSVLISRRYRSPSEIQTKKRDEAEHRFEAGNDHRDINVGMRWRKSWSSTFGSWTVMIEQTVSDEAPCKSWMLCDKIGSGRFGEVRLAVDPTVKDTAENWNGLRATRRPKYYAVKRAKFTSDQNGQNDEVLSIFHEIVMISKLRHPNIVRYYGNGVANEHICLFLEWCSIGSMADILQIRKSFSIPRIHHYLSNLLDAIS